MAQDPDLLFDRRRLARKLTLWRLAAIGLGVAAVLVAIGRFAGGFERDYVARLVVDGVIVEDRVRDEALADAAKDDRIAALLVVINSPGGSVVGGEDLYRRLLMVAEKKPVVAVMGTVAASAAYMTAIAADRIFAREGTITGSIGVLLQTTEISGLLAKLGIAAESIKSAPLKAQPSLFEPMTEEARAATRSLIMDTYDMFVGMVAERRRLSLAATQALADGRVFTGRQAAGNGLIDELGDERAARAWLATARAIDEALPTRPLPLPDDVLPWPRLATALFGKTFLSEALILDGLVSVWHPEMVAATTR